MLYLVGLGLREGDLTLRGKETLERCEEIYTDTYTAPPYRIFGKPAGRELVESDFLVKLAAKKDVALAVPGDPLFATTHLALFLEARSRGVPVEVIHAPSIINAVARTGLSSYKFGRIVTTGRTVAESDAGRIRQNLDAGLHTLCLFDPEEDPGACVRALRDFAEKVVLCSRLGTRDERILYGNPEKLAGKDVKKPACAIIPAKLHFFEKDFLDQFSTE